MLTLLIGIISIVGTILIYLLSEKLYGKIHTPFTLPVLTATVGIIVLLLIFDIPYDSYMVGGDVISELLGPAVVALAYPLYKNRQVVRKMAVSIFTGVTTGACVGVLSGLLMAKWLGFDDKVLISMSPKSVTTPVAMKVSEFVGGIPAVSIVFVMIAGIGGAILSQVVYKCFHIDNTIGRGVSIGCASHAIGTSKAMESSELEGSISTVSMILSAIIVSVITPTIVTILVG